MRLIYLYYRGRNYPFKHVQSDGHYDLIREMVKQEIVPEAHIYWEEYASRAPKVYAEEKNFTAVSVPNIDNIKVQPGDVIWVRGGWKAWLPKIEEWIANKHWLLYYGANTGHERWTFWDFIFTDCKDLYGYDRHYRTWIPYRKPVSSTFGYKEKPLTYDVCIGASHVTKRKGQWRTWNMIEEYQKQFGTLNCIIPGDFTPDFKTRTLYSTVSKLPNVTTPGFVSREKLCDIFNRTKVFIHLGGGGQNDRSVLEAGTCGCKIILLNGKWHSSFIKNNTENVFVFKDTRCVFDVDETPFADGVAALYKMLNTTTHKTKKAFADFFKWENGLQQRAIPAMKKLFVFLKKHPRASHEAIEREFPRCS